jgi:hypothetical protein
LERADSEPADDIDDVDDDWDSCDESDPFGGPGIPPGLEARLHGAVLVFKDAALPGGVKVVGYCLHTTGWMFMESYKGTKLVRGRLVVTFEEWQACSASFVVRFAANARSVRFVVRSRMAPQHQAGWRSGCPWALAAGS